MWMLLLILLIIAGVYILLRNLPGKYPICPIKKGEKVNVFLGYIPNRCATVSNLTNSYLTIYNVFQMPISYRGKFYSVGKLDDGQKVYYLSKKRHIFYAHLAELIRKIIEVPAYAEEEAAVDNSTKNEDLSDGQA
ncbi:MAG: hypothetical protein AB2L20_11815 [Mangrovibacterium sp.]